MTGGHGDDVGHPGHRVWSQAAAAERPHADLAVLVPPPRLHLSGLLECDDVLTPAVEIHDAGESRYCRRAVSGGRAAITELPEAVPTPGPHRLRLGRSEPSRR